MATSALAFIIIVSALFSGAVEVWSSTVVLFLTFTLGLAWVFGEGLHGERARHEKRVIAAGAAFIVYVLVQIVPLPGGLMRFLSPETYHLYSYYSFGNVRFMAISLDRYKTVIELLKISALFTVFLISANRFRKSANLSLMMTFLVVAGFCLSVFALVQKASWNGKLFWFRELTPGGAPFGPFVNRNHFAGYIGMIIPLGMGLAFTSGTKEKRILFGFLSVMMAVALFFSLSRGGIVSFFAGVCLFSLLMLRSRIQSKKAWLILLFLSVVACYVLYLGIDPIVARFYATDIKSEERLTVWAASLAAFRDFWPTGSGLGTFVNVFPLYSPAGIKDIYEHAHNDYIELILETGVIGTVLLLTFTSLLIYPFMRSGFEGRKGIFRIAVASSLFVMAVHSIFDFNLHILSNALLFSAVLGMAAALSDHDELKTDALDMKKKGQRQVPQETADDV
jgi:O-antigen ligase